MRYIKNFFYSLTDIVLAVVIVTLAVGIIYWRMNIILDYPKQLASEQAVYQQEEDTEDVEEDVDSEDEAPADEAAEGASEEPVG